MATTRKTTNKTTTTKSKINNRKETTKMENTNNYFQATPILIYYATKSKSGEALPHDKYYTNEDHDSFHTIKDKITDQPYTTLDTQIIFQTEDNNYYIVKAQLPKTETITDSAGHTFINYKNYLRDYVIKPMLAQQGGLDADKDNFTIINAAIDQKLQFTLEQTYFTYKDGTTGTDYHIVNTNYKR